MKTFLPAPQDVSNKAASDYQKLAELGIRENVRAG